MLLDLSWGGGAGRWGPTPRYPKRTFPPPGARFSRWEGAGGGRFLVTGLFAVLCEQPCYPRAEIIAARKKVRETLGRHAEWMQGADEIDRASWDLLAVEVLWPA
jgi:hypothetical protein